MYFVIDYYTNQHFVRHTHTHTMCVVYVLSGWLEFGKLLWAYSRLKRMQSMGNLDWTSERLSEQASTRSKERKR